MRTALLIGLCAASISVAKPKVPPAPTPPPVTEPVGSSADLLAKAKELYAALEYDKVIPLTNALLSRDDLPLESKLEAHRLNGSAKAIVQDPLDAEQPFRLLLRLRPDYDLPKDTPPKILAAFRKVQTEERAIAEQAALFDREKKIEGLKLLDEPPKTAKGGRPVPFSLRLRDPGAAVDSVTVPYRRAGQPAYSSLALTRNEEGRWSGQIPAEYTADAKGFTLEYYIETADAKGPLLAQGTAGKPMQLDVSAGQVVSGKPPPLHKNLFWAGFALTAGAGAASGVLGALYNVWQGQYHAMSGTSAGADAVALQHRGDGAALGTNIALVTTGVFAVLTALMLPFVDWDAAQQ